MPIFYKPYFLPRNVSRRGRFVLWLQVRSPRSGETCSRDVAGKRVPLSVLCVEKIVFSCGSGDHAAAEKNTQRPFQETLLRNKTTQRWKEIRNVLFKRRCWEKAQAFSDGIRLCR